ncbi:hypothetical protein HDU67_004133 [Dinochytrium kinnereticum]|nr:hypothetical protein HDU67_004133 [Dinochytrium kinnereticum]
MVTGKTVPDAVLLLLRGRQMNLSSALTGLVQCLTGRKVSHLAERIERTVVRDADVGFSDHSSGPPKEREPVTRKLRRPSSMSAVEDLPRCLKCGLGTRVWRFSGCEGCREDAGAGNGVPCVLLEPTSSEKRDSAASAHLTIAAHQVDDEQSGFLRRAIARHNDHSMDSPAMATLRRSECVDFKMDSTLCGTRDVTATASRRLPWVPTDSIRGGVDSSSALVSGEASALQNSDAVTTCKDACGSDDSASEFWWPSRPEKEGCGFGAWGDESFDKSGRKRRGNREGEVGVLRRRDIGDGGRLIHVGDALTGRPSMQISAEPDRARSFSLSLQRPIRDTSFSGRRASCFESITTHIPSTQIMPPKTASSTGSSESFLPLATEATSQAPVDEPNADSGGMWRKMSRRMSMSSFASFSTTASTKSTSWGSLFGGGEFGWRFGRSKAHCNEDASESVSGDGRRKERSGVIEAIKRRMRGLRGDAARRGWGKGGLGWEMEAGGGGGGGGEGGGQGAVGLSNAFPVLIR